MNLFDMKAIILQAAGDQAELLQESVTRMSKMFDMAIDILSWILVAVGVFMLVMSILFLLSRKEELKQKNSDTRHLRSFFSYCFGDLFAAFLLQLMRGAFQSETTLSFWLILAVVVVSGLTLLLALVYVGKIEAQREYEEVRDMQKRLTGSRTESRPAEDGDGEKESVTPLPAGGKPLADTASGKKSGKKRKHETPGRGKPSPAPSRTEETPEAIRLFRRALRHFRKWDTRQHGVTNGQLAKAAMALAYPPDDASKPKDIRWPWFKMGELPRVEDYVFNLGLSGGFLCAEYNRLGNTDLDDQEMIRLVETACKENKDIFSDTLYHPLTDAETPAPPVDVKPGDYAKAAICYMEPKKNLSPRQRKDGTTSAGSPREGVWPWDPDLWNQPMRNGKRDRKREIGIALLLLAKEIELQDRIG